MNKSVTIHTRVTPEIKKQAESIFQSVGLTTSQAISIFLVASVNHNGLPFKLSMPNKWQQDLDFASAIVKIDGVTPSNNATNIIRSYLDKETDYDEALKAIKRIYKPV